VLTDNALVADLEPLVDIAVRAWEPVHASMGNVLGERLRLNRRVYPDWAASQASDVRSACEDPTTQVFVATDDQALIGFASVAIDTFRRSGEVDMPSILQPSAEASRALSQNTR
jgi:hypothetical protein